MKKTEIKAIVEANNMGLLKNNITNQTVGFWCDSESSIPELDELLDWDGSVIATKEKTYPGYRYKVYCPSHWLDMWGFAD